MRSSLEFVIDKLPGHATRHEDASEAVAPTMRPLDHPPPRPSTMAATPLGFLSRATNMGDEVVLGQGSQHELAVIAVSEHMCWARFLVGLGRRIGRLLSVRSTSLQSFRFAPSTATPTGCPCLRPGAAAASRSDSAQLSRARRWMRRAASPHRPPR